MDPARPRLERAPAPENREAPALYRIYGLAVRSALALPCPRVGRHTRADVELHPAEGSEFARAHQDIGDRRRGRHWFRYRRLTNGGTYLGWAGLSEFVISPDGRRIEYRRDRRAAPEALTTYLLGHVLSFSLVARGLEPLHGTVVVTGSEAIGFLGDCGYGKSTLAAAMLARGLALLTDDLVVLNESGGGWSVQPGIPRLKLYPSAAREFLRWESRGPCMNRGTSKLVVPLGPGQAVSEAVPLKALYVLSDPRPRRRRRLDRVQIDRVSGRDAFFEIVRATFNLLVMDRTRLAAQFGLATRLAHGVPISRLTYPRGLSRLPEICDAVLADLRLNPRQPSRDARTM